MSKAISNVSTKIMLLGPMGSGKSTVAYGLATKLGVRCYEEKFKGNPLLEDYFKTGKGAFASQMWFLKEYMSKSRALKDQYAYISDAGAPTGLAFVLTQTVMGQLSQLECDLYLDLWVEVFIKGGLLDKSAKYIFLDREEDDLLSKVKSRGRAFESGVDSSYLLEQRSANLAVLIKLQEFGFNALLAHLFPDDSKDSVVNKIISGPNS